MPIRIVPVVEHVSLWVAPGRTDLAIELFGLLGWLEWPNRQASWDTGSARFIYPSVGGVYLQLTEESSQTPASRGSASHVALICDVSETMQILRGWADQHDFAFVWEDVGGGKLMVEIPPLFQGALELIPSAHPDYEGLLKQSLAVMLS